MRIFINPSGQRENLGDSVLRRGYINELRELGEVHVLAGAHASYVSGLGLTDADCKYATKREWFSAAFNYMRRERSVFAVNAGEVVTGRNFATSYVWQYALAQAVRAGGGATVAMGMGNREEPGTTRLLLRRFAHGADFVTWRDESACAQFGVGSVQPDWAAALGQPDAELMSGSSARTRVVVSLRGDRDVPDANWFTAVEESLAAMGSPEVIAVVQVLRDTDRARELAHRFGGRTLEWPTDRSHAEHEQVLRALYRTSKAVISDRIHALIIGMTEGAVPIGFTPHSAQKVSKTFRAIAPSTAAWSAQDATIAASDHTSRILAAAQDGQIIMAELVSARARLRETCVQLRAAIDAPVDGRS
ncbi:polysaccharide pyruvyl transferase family protein [Microbacterium sp. NPDC076911]|uniref:polysaccharide pyruvyl transferase family protein n=1 Tax=Microbacterium sp. NPDC076911 TaxID=3154958 RepID=UPI0034240D37